jgi:hypothetical protein
MGSGIDSLVDVVMRGWSKTTFGFFQCTHDVIHIAVSSYSAAGKMHAGANDWHSVQLGYESY